MWDEPKRRANLKKHGLDFADAARVFAGITFTFEDKRFHYDEQGFMTMGLLNETAVMIAHTESASEVHVISMRKATKHEQTIYFQNL
ncbi:MAG TPA: BrnT family toxin [Burkholderiales bacterium]|nr:BrnT family toxin [Burkholderiales bacterium]